MTLKAHRLIANAQIIAYRALLNGLSFARSIAANAIRSGTRELVLELPMRAAKITRTALILVGPAMAETQEFVDSALYDAQKPHVLRPVVGVDLVEEHNS